MPGSISIHQFTLKFCRNHISQDTSKSLSNQNAFKLALNSNLNIYAYILKLDSNSRWLNLQNLQKKPDKILLTWLLLGYHLLIFGNMI